ncbi:hypothetical protein Tco_0797554 [Tanacetum coccineum]
MNCESKNFLTGNCGQALRMSKLLLPQNTKSNYWSSQILIERGRPKSSVTSFEITFSSVEDDILDHKFSQHGGSLQNRNTMGPFSHTKALNGVFNFLGAFCLVGKAFKRRNESLKTKKYIHDDFMVSHQIVKIATIHCGTCQIAEYGVSSSLSNTTYSSQQINTAYLLLLDTAYRSSGTEIEIIDFHAKKFLPSFETNPTDCLSLVSEQEMAETMEKYMSKTRTDYGSGVARPKIDNKDQFELKGQFLKELRENTFTEVILFYNGLDVPTRHILDSRGVVPTKTVADAKTAIQEMAEYSQKCINGNS